MFKIIIALSLILAIQGQIDGGYEERPDLIKDADTQNMVKLAVLELANIENRKVTPIEVISVAMQLVDGLNYRIIFTASEGTTTNALSCSTVIYETFTGTQSVTSVECA